MESEAQRGPLGGLRAALPPAPGEGAAGDDEPGIGRDPLGGGPASTATGPGPMGIVGGTDARPSRRGATAPPRRACPLGICDGSGWIVGDDGGARGCECRQRRIERARSRGMQGSLPRRFRGVSFDRPPVSDMARRPGFGPTVKRVREMCKTIDERLDAGDGAWLMGDVGTGKTSLAMLISKAALAAHRSVAIYSLPRLLARIRRTYDAEAGEEGYLAFFDRLSSVDLLHIDDLGAEKRSDWVLEQLYAIVDRRYEEQRSIVVTTNLEVPELEEQIGPRTVSRLVEICGDPLPLYGSDKRQEYKPDPADLDPPQPS